MKRWAIFELVLVIILIGFVNAGSCADNQTIMKIGSPTNSHGSLWDQAYTYDICYDEIFGAEYTGATPHACTAGTNRVLSLYDVNNSHASTTYDAVNYNENVCYGDLACSVAVDPANCPVGSQTVVRLFQNTNSHVSNSSDMNYPIKICCSKTIVSQANWTNTNGQIISSTNMSDTVGLVLTNSGLAPNTPVIFEVYEKDGGWFNDDDKIVNVSGFVDSSGVAKGYWRILPANLTKTVNDYNEFYFRVVGYTSNFLSVSKDPDDDPMNIVIISPKCGSDYNKSDSVEIQINATDADDVITGTVTIEPDVFSFTNGLFSRTYSLTSAGNIQVVAFGSNTRGYMKRIISSIMVVDITKDDYYVAACIDRPVDFSDVGSGDVKFEANSSKGLRYSPVTGRNYIGSGSNKAALNFYWTFSDGKTNPITDGADIYSWSFYKTFVEAGRNWATLEVGIKG